MAENGTVEIEDDGLVTVDLSEHPELADVDPVEPAPKPQPKSAAQQQPRTRQSTTADEAAAALSQAMKTAETEATARKAAEATALAERQRAEAAQRLAEQRAQEAKGYREKAEGHELTIINSGVESATREVAAHQQEFKRAMEAGDFDEASAAQVKLAKAAAALDRLEDAKANYESGVRKTPTAEGRVEAPIQQSAFEQYVSRFDPQAQAWLRTHPECVPSEYGGDATKNAKMMSGHYDALARGLRPNSSEYFQAIEEHVGIREPVTPAAPVSSAATVVQAGSQEPAPRPAPRQTRQAQPSAPVSRDAPAANGAPQTRSVNLTPAQQEIALLATAPREVLGSNGQVVRESDADFKKRAFAQYARELLAATAEGKIGRLTH